MQCFLLTKIAIGALNTSYYLTFNLTYYNMKTNNIYPINTPYTKEQETALFNEYFSTPSSRIKKSIKDKIVLNQVSQVMSIAKTFRDSDDIDDLIQEGMVAVLIAFNKYNPDHDTKFSTYVRPAINGHLIRYLQKNKTLRLPDRTPKILKQINKAKELLSRINKRITTTNIAELTGLDEQQIIDILNGIQLVELNKLNDEGEELINTIEDPTTIEAFNGVESPDLSSLTDVQQQIIMRDFYDGYTDEEIAEQLNIQISDVKQEKLKALDTLRYTLERN